MARGHDWNAFSAQKALLSGNHKSRIKNSKHKGLSKRKSKSQV